MANVGTLAAHLTLNTRMFERGLSGATKRMGGFARNVTKLGLIGAGGMATLGLGAAKMAIDFESSFAGVRKTVDATEEEFAALATGFRNMAQEIPVSVNELNRIGEAAGQLGIKKANILAFSRVMADLGVTTNLASDEAAVAMARLAKITQLPQDQFENMGSTVVALGNNFETTEAEIVNMSLRLAAAGDIIGVTQAETLSFSAALSSVGIRAEAGGTAISRVFIDIANAAASGGEKLDMFANVAGLSSAEFAKAFEEDAAGAIVTFIEGLGRITESGGNVFPVLEALELNNVRVQRALLSAAGAGDTFREALALGSTAWSENTALAEEAAKRYETTASQLRIFMNVVQDVAITIGQALLPTLSDLAKKGAEALRGVDFEGFAKTVGTAIENIVAFIGSIPWGAMLSGIGTVIRFFRTNAIPILAAFGAVGIAAFVHMLPVITAWAAGAITAAIATAVAFAPITIALVAIGVAAGLLVKAWRDDWGNIRQVFVNIVGAIEQRVEDFVNSFIDKWNKIADFLNSFGKDILPTVERKTFNTMRNMAESVAITEKAYAKMTVTGQGFKRWITGIPMAANLAAEGIEVLGETAATAGLDIEGLTRDFGNLGDETEDIADDMRDVESAINAILGMPLAGETAVDDALFNMGQEAKKLEAQLIRMGGRGAEGAEPIEEALKKLRDEMRLTRLEAEIQFDPLKRVLERTAKPIEEIAFGDALSRIFELRPETIDGFAAIAESFGLLVTDVSMLEDLTTKPTMGIWKSQWLEVRDEAEVLLARIQMTETAMERFALPAVIELGGEWVELNKQAETYLGFLAQMEQVGFVLAPGEMPVPEVAGASQVQGAVDNSQRTTNIAITGSSDPRGMAERFAPDARVLEDRDERPDF